MSYIELFKLFGRILIDNEEADRSLAKTDGKGQSLGKTLQEGVKTAAKWGAALAAVGGAMFAMANKTAETADFIDKLSERTGINREELQRWKYAADQSGADIGKLEVGVKKLSETMMMASNGSETNVEAFTKLGISMNDLKKKSQEQIFEDVMYALAEMPQGAERNALGNQLLGKSYTELLPLLNAGAGGMDELKNRADELGLVMSESAVVSAVTFGDTIDDLKMSFGAIVTHLGTRFIPMFQRAADWVLDNMPIIQKVTSKAFGVVESVIAKVGDVLQDFILPTLTKLYNWIEPHFSKIEMLFNVSFGIMKGILQGVVDTVISLTDFFAKHWDIMQPILTGIAAGAVTFGIYTLAINASAIATGIWSTATGIATAAGTAFGAVLAFITSPIGLVVIAIGVLVAAGVALYKNWEKVSKFLGDSWKWVSDAASATKDKILKVWSGIVDGIKGYINKIIDGINNMITKTAAAINSIINLMNKIPGINISQINAPQIPGLADGGTVTRGGRVLVGERAPEVLDLPVGARVTPLDKTAGTANIYVMLDSKTLVSALKAPLANEIRVATGLRI